MSTFWLVEPVRAILADSPLAQPFSCSGDVQQDEQRQEPDQDACSQTYDLRGQQRDFDFFLTGDPGTPQDGIRNGQRRYIGKALAHVVQTGGFEDQGVEAVG